MHNFVKMMKLAAVFLTFSVFLCGVFTQKGHVHANTGGESFKITVKDTKDPNPPSWTISAADIAKSAFVFNITKALTIWGHNPARFGKSQAPFTGQGYQGLEINHVYNNGNSTSSHILHLPKCTKRSLGKAIIEYTSGNKLAQKGLYKNAIDACPTNR
ncbi:uncharacterized protein LOC123554487 [Mercenaria mercenaria]|uniref:uncharacterized protein LOC123554487 n=1 Tax=Mercenaria mercenaria TaxID=6596 RepID=UPI00234F5BDC|nr:uncharacterized protein LOC123554487 [Mercenaria mercenaria]